MTANVRLQNLRDFTVQIRRADSDAIVGTGIAVSMDGKIVTCAHVVKAAGIDPRAANGAEIGVYFPQVRGGEEKKRRATVNCCFRECDDDMVLLQLVEGASPLAPEQIAILGMADQSEGNPFRTYGYSPIGNYPASRGDGVILGSVEPPPDRNLQVDPIQLKSRDIAAGMSGAAVLDATRNLVVGLVAERFYSPGLVQDDLGYGVDSKVLTFDPFNFVLRGESLELRPAPEFRLDKDLFTQAMEIANYDLAHRPAAEKYSWNGAPAVLPEWTGRDDLLAQLTADWLDPQKHVAGLIGFGGEGKSSLARKWVETLLPDNVQPANVPTCDGVFWWGFYENRSVDEFLEATLNYLGGGRIDPKSVPSSSLRAQIIGAMLGSGRYLFVLDGLEVLQHQDGDQYGLLQSNDLRDLLTYFARPDNQSFCLITSRAPLLDLMEYTTYSHHDVDRLSEKDGRDLLRKLGVKGSDADLNKVVSDWDGHALTVSLLGTYIRDDLAGEFNDFDNPELPVAGTPRFENVKRVLASYDSILSDSERALLMLLSLFYGVIEKKILIDFIHDHNYWGSLCKPIAELSLAQFEIILEKLVRAHLIKSSFPKDVYTTHPLIKAFYSHLIRKEKMEEYQDAVEDIANYYGQLAREKKVEIETISDLKPQIDAIRYYCRCGKFDDAMAIYEEINGRKTNHLHRLGMNNSALDILRDFFSDGNIRQKPMVNSLYYAGFIYNSIGLCLEALGFLFDAMYFYNTSLNSDIGAHDYFNVSVHCLNLSRSQAQLGLLDNAIDTINQALNYVTDEKAKFETLKSVNDARHKLNIEQLSFELEFKAYIFYLKGDLLSAEANFQKVKSMHQESPSDRELLDINCAKYLRRTGQSDYARRVTEANLQICEQQHWVNQISLCHRVLGDLDSDVGDHTSARAHYESALKIARSISHRSSLIEALLGRGRFLAKTSEFFKNSEVSTADAFNDLNEALTYAVEGGYRIYEADIRVALAWAWLALTPGPSPKSGRGELLAKAKAEAERALQMSAEMGYYWGKLDAEEVLKKIK